MRSSAKSIGAAVANNDFTSQDVKEGKQAEFLIHERFPCELVRRIGVRSESVCDQVLATLSAADHRPTVVVRPDWYF